MRASCYALVVLSAFSAGCRDTVQPGPSAELATITIQPTGAALFVGNSVQLRAVGLTASGDSLPETRVLWSSTNPAVATVDTTGRAVALAFGVARIVATSGKIQRSAELIVLDCPAVVVRPASVTLRVGDTTRAIAVGCQATAADFSWLSSAPDVVAVTDNGLLTALAIGKASIVARYRADTSLFATLAATVAP